MTNPLPHSNRSVTTCCPLAVVTATALFRQIFSISACFASETWVTPLDRGRIIHGIIDALPCLALPCLAEAMRLASSFYGAFRIITNTS